MNVISNEFSHIGITFVLLLIAPAVEIKSHTAERTAGAFHKHRPGVADPQIVYRVNQKIDRRSAQTRGEFAVFFAYQHIYGFKCGDGFSN